MAAGHSILCDCNRYSNAHLLVCLQTFVFMYVAWPIHIGTHTCDVHTHADVHAHRGGGSSTQWIASVFFFSLSLSLSVCVFKSCGKTHFIAFLFHSFCFVFVQNFSEQVIITWWLMICFFHQMPGHPPFSAPRPPWGSAASMVSVGSTLHGQALNVCFWLAGCFLLRQVFLLWFGHWSSFETRFVMQKK